MPNPKEQTDENGVNEEQNRQEEPDYKALYEKEKANSSKWEKYAKANLDKAKQYDEAADELGKANEQRTTFEERLRALEDENKQLRMQQARAAAVSEVAGETGLPESVIAALGGNTKDELAEAAKSVAEYVKRSPAPYVGSDGKAPAKPAKQKDTAHQFAQAFSEYFDR